MLSFLFERKKPFLSKNDFTDAAVLLQPLKLAYLLQEVEYSQRPWSKFNPHVQINSTVVIKNITTGSKRRITLVPPNQRRHFINDVSFHSPLGVALLGHKINHIIEYKEAGESHLWEIIAINIKEEI